MSPSRPARGHRRIRPAATGLVAAALLAACTSGGGGGAAGKALPGITDENVKVGYVVVDTFELNKNLGLVQPNYGDVATISRGITAVTDWVNANGGAGDRTIDPLVVPFNAALSSPELVQSTCAQLTQDEQVFAAVLDGQYQDNALPCYFGANTLMLDQTVTAHDQTQFEQYKNYLWSPTQPEYSSYLVAQLDTLRAQGYFEGATTVQLLTSGDEVSRRVADTVAKPWLSTNGITSVRVDYVDSTNTGTLGATSKVALQSGKASGANRVVTVGGARILPVALSDVEMRDFDARFSISTSDNPLFVQDNPDTIVTERRVGMIGLGFNPPADVSGSKGAPFPDPTNPAQVECVRIISEAGAAPPLDDGQVARQNWRIVLAYCDATMMLKKALDAVGGGSEVTAQQFAEGVASLGSTLRSASTFGSSWGPGVYAGTNQGRPLAWREDCLCFDYLGELVTFQPQQAVTSVAPSSVPATGAPATSVPPASVTPSQPVASVAPTQVTPTVPAATVPTATVPTATVPSTTTVP